uniref:Epstein-Barr virus-like protein n=1 Tax=Oryza sativa subsp. japonica TaxID=39947 RepID=Q5VPN3_ORYSJ|nr:Epstein-Barr virus-like protein [Oryza sativa Japonica Group]
MASGGGAHGRRQWQPVAGGGGGRRKGGGAAKDGGASGEGEEKEGEGVLTRDSAGVGEDDDGRRRQAVDGWVRGMDEVALDLARPTAATERCGDGTTARGSGGTAAVRGKRAVAEIAPAATKLAAASARRGSDPSNGGVRPETATSGGACGERRERGRKHGRERRVGEKREESRGRLFMGEGEADVARNGLYLAGDVGEVGRERGIQMNPPPPCARAHAGEVRMWAATWVRVWAEWESEESGGVGGDCRLGRGGWRLGKGLTGGPHLSAPEGVRGRRPGLREGAGEMGRRPMMKGEGGKRGFSRDSLMLVLHFNWLKLFLGL